MSEFDIRYYYDGVKFLKGVDSCLYSKIKKIRRLKSIKTEGFYGPYIRYIDNKKDKEYLFRSGHKSTHLYHDLGTKLHTIISVNLHEDNDYYLTIYNYDISYIITSTVYNLSKKDKDGKTIVNSEMKALFDHFKITPESRFLKSEKEQQLLSLFQLNNSSYPILMACIEENITELNDETFTYLMFKAMI